MQAVEPTLTADGSTLEVAAGNTLRIKDLGVSTAKLAANAATAAKVGADVATQAELDAVLGSLFSAVDQPVRAVDTTYQAGATARLVIIDVDGSGSARLELRVGEADPPATIICSTAQTTVARQKLVAIVPAGQYYRAHRTAAVGFTVNAWTEADV